MGKAAKVEGFSKQQLRINFMALEQDLRSYDGYRHFIACELGIKAGAEVDDMLRAGGLPELYDGAGQSSGSLKATVMNDLYAVGAKDTKFKPLAIGHQPEYQKAHNLVRNVSNPTMGSGGGGGYYGRCSIGMIYLRRLIDTCRAILITFDRLERSEVKEDRIKAEVARMYYFERHKTQAGIALYFSNEGHPVLGNYPMAQQLVSRFCRDVVYEVAACLGVVV